MIVAVLHSPVLHWWSTRANIVAFVAGVWLLQWQGALPGLTSAAWLLLPMILLVIVRPATRPTATAWFRRVVTATLCAGLGFFWAAWSAQSRLAGELPGEWEGQDLSLIGVVASLPQSSDRSLRFEFDVERVLTPGAKLPRHLLLSWFGS